MDTLRQGQQIWVEQADGSLRAGIFVGEAEGSWFGGTPGAYVAYPDTRSGEEVAIMRIVARDEPEQSRADGQPPVQGAAESRPRSDRMIIIPSVEATVLGELRTLLPSHSVTVVPEDYEPPAAGIQTIGAAFAPTPEGREALRVAAVLARAGSARLRAITVLDPKRAAEQSGAGAQLHSDVDPAEAPAARHRLEEEAELRAALDNLGEDIDSEPDILFNDPVDGLLAAARHVDLLVMGSRGRGPLRAAILGSVSHSVSQHAPCPVVILPRA